MHKEHPEDQSPSIYDFIPDSFQSFFSLCFGVDLRRWRNHFGHNMLDLSSALSGQASDILSRSLFLLLFYLL